MNTAASNGENLPREYPSKRYGLSVQSGCTIVCGGGYVLVDRTGIHTEAGAAQADIAADIMLAAKQLVSSERWCVPRCDQCRRRGDLACHHSTARHYGQPVH